MKTAGTKVSKPRNAARCLRCKDVIESTHRHDYKSCSCGNVCVDGGSEYSRRCFRSDEWENVGLKCRPRAHNTHKGSCAVPLEVAS